VWDVLTFCSECRQIFLVFNTMPFHKIEVEYDEVAIPFGCPDPFCKGGRAPVTVRLPRGGGQGIHKCEGCNTVWQVTDDGREWINLPQKPYRTLRAITNCQSCGARMSYYMDYFPNNEISAACRACDARIR
jgi:hypothetical protein